VTPLEIITEGKWDHALFTTYALSLSFYETQLHKLGLAQRGCRDIRIVADADGYQLSLSERQSHRVGNESRLTPTALPNGVFHPKIVWLAGKELDVVLLGSGNLTFGGFGKNVECLEVIRSDQAPVFFNQLGAMMSAWSSRDDLRFPESSWLEFWAERAQKAGSADVTADATTPVLIHSTQESIGEQIAARVRNHGRVSEVRSLSPYYDHDAGGILSYAESILSPGLTVGLLPGRENGATFPFGRSRSSSCRPTAAVFSAPEDGRHLHAKVLEICMEDGSIFLVTGSVNATRKSLTTSDNIETAVLRHYPDATQCPFLWEPCSIPVSFRTSEFKKAGLGSRVLVSGRLTGEGRIEGTLISQKDPQGPWQGILQRIDGVSADLNLTVSSSGHFSQEVENLDLFQHSAGLQLRVIGNDGEGTGWVSVEGLLMAARRGFLSPAILARFLNSEADESDETELLRYLAVSAQRHLPAFASGRKISSRSGNPKGNEAGKGDQARSIPLHLLVAHESWTEPGSQDATQREDAMLNSYMSRIRQNLLRFHRQESGVEELDETGDDKASKREEKEREIRRKQLTVSLTGFQEKLRSLALMLPPGEDRAAALCMWFEVTLSVLLRRLNQADEAEMFLKQWLSQALTGQRLGNSSDALTGHVLASLLTLASIDLSRTSEGSRTLGRLHEQIEFFCEGTHPASLCQDLVVLDPLHPPTAAEILERLPSAPALDRALEILLTTATPRQQLAQIVEAHASGLRLPNDLPIFEIPAAREFAAQIESGRNPKFLPVTPSTTACPHCYRTLRRATKTEVEQDRFGICLDCGRFLIASA
jgi:hypothetical protein